MSSCIREDLCLWFCLGCSSLQLVNLPRIQQTLKMMCDARLMGPLCWSHSIAPRRGKLTSFFTCLSSRTLLGTAVKAQGALMHEGLQSMNGRCPVARDGKGHSANGMEPNQGAASLVKHDLIHNVKAVHAPSIAQVPC